MVQKELFVFLLNRTISLWVTAVPFPCSCDDFFKICMFWLPAKDILRFFTGSDQDSRISSSSSFFHSLDRLSCHFSGSFDYFFYGKSNTISKVEDIAFIAFHQVFHCQNMCLCKVRYMNVVSYTSSIFCIIISSEDTDCFSFSIWHL